MRAVCSAAVWWHAAARPAAESEDAGVGDHTVVDVVFGRPVRFPRRRGPAEVEANATACLEAAQAAGCTQYDSVLSLGREPGVPPSIRSLFDDVFRLKLGVFGGPAVGPAVPTPTTAGAEADA